MCGRFTNHLTWRQIHDLYELTNDDFRPNIRPNYNAAPTQSLPVVRLDERGARVLAIMRWGFERAWAKSSIINATAEKLATSNVFKRAFQERRCVVPADGFYEWQKRDDGKRRPLRITLANEEPFAFAGIWEHWTADKAGFGYDAGDDVETFCIVTTRPNELMRPIHNRMPVILARESYGAWLDGTDADRLLDPFDASRMRAYEVSPRVNSVRNNDEACIAPVS